MVDGFVVLLSLAHAYRHRHCRIQGGERPFHEFGFPRLLSIKELAVIRR